MAAKSKRPFDYIAHVQREGKVTELAGTREDYNMKLVYQWLLQLAQSMGGWLLAEQITEAGEEPPVELVHTSEPANDEAAKPSTQSAVLGDLMYWGAYNGERYSGASRLTFKEKKGE